MLYDVHKRAWDEELLALFRVPHALLPAVVPSSAVYGKTAKSLFGAQIPIAGMAGDQQAALFGQACHEPGMAKNTYGTGCFVLLNTGGKPIASRNGLIATTAAGARQYALEGSVFVGGAVVQWLRDGLHLIKKSVDVEKLAATVTDAGGVYSYRSFTGLGAPHWGRLCARYHRRLTRGSNAGHKSRALRWNRLHSSPRKLLAMEQDARVRSEGNAGSTAARRRRYADGSSRPISWACRWCGPRFCKRRRWGPPIWRVSRPACGGTRRDRAAVEACAPLRAADEARAGPGAAGGNGARALERAKGWQQSC